MQHVRDLWAAGEYPGHHLWGADALERAGFTVEHGFFGQNRRSLRALSFRLGDRAGDLEQQLALLRRAREAPGTVVYAGESSMVRTLATLRRRGLWRGPLVGVVHAPGPEVRGLDVAICLSTALRDEVVQRYGRDGDTTLLAAWGPDLAFPGYAAGDADDAPADAAGSGSPLVVSTGKTDRDTETLLRGLRGTGLAARVYVDRAPAAPPEGVELVAIDASRPLPYAEALADLRAADLIAIPLTRTDRLLALTEIADALALGKPIVMTRTATVDFDPEALGCGLTVAIGDVRGWHDALTRLAGDQPLRTQMGDRARAIAQDGYDAVAFGGVVVDAIERAASPRPR